MLHDSLGTYAGRAGDTLVQLRGGFERRFRALREIEEEARRELAQRRADYDDADEDDDVEDLLRAIDDAEQRLADIRRWVRDVASYRSQLQARAAAYSETLSRSVPAARRFLQEKIDQLKRYGALQLETDVPMTVATPLAVSADSVPRDVPDDALLVQPLPRGFRWVPLSEVDLDTQLSGVAGPRNFTKVPYETVRDGFGKLKNEILPALRADPTRRTDYFRELDQERGLDYSDGLQRVYEAFFGQHDYVYFVRRPDGSLDVTNGRHRLKVAHDLGWDAIPAQVKE